MDITSLSHAQKMKIHKREGKKEMHIVDVILHEALEIYLTLKQSL